MAMGSRVKLEAIHGRATAEIPEPMLDIVVEEKTFQ